MASFLWMSQDGAGCAMAYRVRLANHDVIVWIENPKFRHLYDGLLKKVDKYEQGLKKGVTVVFDTVTVGVPKSQIPQKESEWNGYTNLADRLRKQGYAVVGSCSLADRLELDRTWGADLAKRAGLKVPVSLAFNDIPKALAHVKAHPSRYVVKPHGNLDTFKVYVSKNDDGTDLIDYLEQAVKKEKELKTLELQEYIDGQQMSIEGWWNGTKLVGHNSTFEYKPIYHGGSGPLSGEVGSVIYYYPDGKTTKMQRDVLLKLEPILKELKFSPGPIDLNCLINEEGAWFLEYSPRFGYPAAYLQLFAVEDDWGAVCAALGDGTFSGFHPKPFKWFVGNRMWIPWWPKGETQKGLEDYPIFGNVRKQHLPHLSFVDVHYADGRLRTGGTDGELLCLTNGGDSIAEAQAKNKQMIEEILIYPMGWRDDVGEHILLASMDRWGYWLPALM